jgi:predicted RNase H-like HicB family nuclease
MARAYEETATDEPRFRLEWEEAMTYAVLIEQGPSSFGATVPDLPGCVAVAATREEAEHLIQEAITLHLKGLREDGLPVPPPVTQVATVEVA